MLLGESNSQEKEEGDLKKTCWLAPAQTVTIACNINKPQEHHTNTTKRIICVYTQITLPRSPPPNGLRWRHAGREPRLRDDKSAGIWIGIFGWFNLGGGGTNSYQTWFRSVLVLVNSRWKRIPVILELQIRCPADFAQFDDQNNPRDDDSLREPMFHTCPDSVDLAKLPEAQIFTVKIALFQTFATEPVANRPRYWTTPVNNHEARSGLSTTDDRVEFSIWLTG